MNNTSKIIGYCGWNADKIYYLFKSKLSYKNNKKFVFNNGI